MSDIAHLAATLFRKASGSKRLIVAIVGPPGAGKSAFAEALLPLLPEGAAAIQGGKLCACGPGLLRFARNDGFGLSSFWKAHRDSRVFQTVSYSAR